MCTYFALSASPRPPSSRYIIFLSDGDENDHYSDDPTYFEKGIGVPTTFTVFFTQSTFVPGTIRRMTENIKSNGYSLSNPKSRYLPFKNTDFAALMNIFMNDIFGSVVTGLPLYPQSADIGGSTSAAWNQADLTFTFASLFPLTGRVTPFNCQIKYPTKDGGDTTRVIDFAVKTKAGFIMPAGEFAVKRWDRDIVFRYNGAPISSATEAMNQIELFFLWNGGTADYKYTNVSIDLYTAVPPLDHETIPLTASGANAFGGGTFKKVSSGTKFPGNGILECLTSGDSIVAVFRNSETPKLPLDTLRVALAVNTVTGAQQPSISRPAVDGFTVTGAVARCTLAKQARISLRLYDIRGRLIESVSPVTLGAGSYAIPLSKDRLPPGQYVIEMRAGDNRMATLAAGAYFLRLTGFDGEGRKKAERVARIMYLP